MRNWFCIFDCLNESSTWTKRNECWDLQIFLKTSLVWIKDLKSFSSPLRWTLVYFVILNSYSVAWVSLKRQLNKASLEELQHLVAFNMFCNYWFLSYNSWNSKLIASCSLTSSNDSGAVLFINDSKDAIYVVFKQWHFELFIFGKKCEAK